MNTQTTSLRSRMRQIEQKKPVTYKDIDLNECHNEAVNFDFLGVYYFVPLEIVEQEFTGVGECEVLEGGYDTPIYRRETVNYDISTADENEMKKWLFKNMCKWELMPE